MSTQTLVSTTLAGVFASVVENGVTYPLEYLKVRQQLAVKPPGHPAARFAIPQFTHVMYQGFAPFVMGNALRTVLRFNVFNYTTQLLEDKNSNDRPSAPTVVVAGMFTGLAETLFVVPFESIKTTMIEASSVGKGAATGALPPLGANGTQLVLGQDAPPNAHVPHIPKIPKAQNVENDAFVAGEIAEKRKSGGKPSHPPPRRVRPPPSAAPPSAPKGPGGLEFIEGPQSTIRTVYTMYKSRGLRAFVQGFNPTVIRQVTNSMLRFTAWNAWTQVVSVDGEDRMSIFQLLAGSAVVSGIEAVITQPIDVIKTRLQAANGIKLYGNSLVCAYRVFVEEGYKQLWSGLGLRWVRKWVSGGVVWFVYETSFNQLDKSMRQHPFK